MAGYGFLYILNVYFLVEECLSYFSFRIFHYRSPIAQVNIRFWIVLTLPFALYAKYIIKTEKNELFLPATPPNRTTHPRISTRCATFLAFEVQMRRERQSLLAVSSWHYFLWDLQREISWRPPREALFINSSCSLDFGGSFWPGAAVVFGECKFDQCQGRAAWE